MSYVTQSAERIIPRFIPTRFYARNVSVLHYANGFTGWLYKDMTRPIGEMTDHGFFDEAVGMFKVGDIVTIVGEGGSAQRCVADASARNGVYLIELS